MKFIRKIDQGFGHGWDFYIGHYHVCYLVYEDHWYFQIVKI
jgi:hypothetical protein